MHSSRALLLVSLMLVLASSLPLNLPGVGVGTPHHLTAMPSTQPPREGGFVNVSHQANLTAMGNFYAWGDIDGDSYWDLLVDGKRLYRNSGPPTWSFVEVTESSGLGAVEGAYMGVWGDYNGDGLLDIFVGGRLGYQDHLLRNNGDGTFTDVSTTAFGETDTNPTTAATWIDYDRDGDLDLYVVKGEDWNGGNYRHFPDVLWRNNGDGTFTDVTLQAGVDTSSSPAYGRGVQLCDFNLDGWPDLYVSNYRLKPNYLWRNNGDGTFTDVAEELGVAGVYDPDRYYDDMAGRYYGQYWWGPTYGHTIGSSFADLDRDGYMDLFTANLVHKYVGPTSQPSMPYDIRGYVCDDSKLYRNMGPPDFRFVDVRENSSIPIKPIGAPPAYQGDELFSGVAAGDYDNDGFVDLFIPQIYNLSYAYSFLYRNRGNMSFEDVTLREGVRVWNTYGGVFCDYDNDGDLDLITGGKAPFMVGSRQYYETHLFRNEHGGAYLKVRLEGAGMNRYGIGARVTLRLAGGGLMVREMTAGESCHGHQGPPELHFGLGEEMVESVEVRWPTGGVTVLQARGVANTTLVIREEESGFTLSDLSVSPEEPSEDQQVNVTVSVQPRPALYMWDLDEDLRWDRAGGNPSISASYTTSGLKRIRLWVLNDRGVGREIYPLTISVVNVPPSVNGSEVLSGEMESPLTLSVEVWDTPSDLPEILVRWDFGDGEVAEGRLHTTVNHTYLDPGDYTVKVTAVDDDGAEGEFQIEVRIVNPPPRGNFTVEGVLEEDYSLLFRPRLRDTPSHNSSIMVMWDFGDGTTTGWDVPGPIYHAYTDAGNYTVRLHARDPLGAESVIERTITISDPPPVLTPLTGEPLEGEEDVPVHFSGLIDVKDNPSDSADLTFMWDFGDGESTSWRGSPDALHTYHYSGIYEAVLYVKDDSGNVVSASFTVEISNVPPEVSLSRRRVDVYEDEVVVLQAEGEDSPTDSESLLYRWTLNGELLLDFSPNSTLTLSFERSGVYNVTVTVKDPEGVTSEDFCTIYVENLPPRGEINITSAQIVEDEVLWVSAVELQDSPSDMGSLSITWLVDEVARGEGVEFSVSFPSSGTHTLAMVVRDDDGATYRTEIRVTVMNVPPVAHFIFGALSPSLYYFNASSSSDTPSDWKNLTFKWDFGDGEGAWGINVTHRFAPGRYHVELTVRDDDGYQDTFSAEVVVPETGGGGGGISEGGLTTALALAVAAAVSLALLAVLMWRRGRGGTPGMGPGAGGASVGGSAEAGPPAPPNTFK